MSAGIAELTPAEIDGLLHEQLVGRIGCHADGHTYVVPVIYAYDGEAVYVASTAGRKVRMMRERPHVCFEVDEYAGRGSWRSVILQGIYEELEGEDAARALRLLAARFPPPADGEPVRRRAESGGEVVCFRIRLVEATGRAVDRGA